MTPVDLDPLTAELLAEALRLHDPDLLIAFAQVEAGVSVDSWEAYHQAAPKERAA